MFAKINAESRIVIIDDVPTNLRLLDSCLRAVGLRNITTFSDSAQGLDWLLSNAWDLVLLDLDMPAPDGFEILDRLNKRDRTESPVIIVTALNDQQNRRKGLEKGANDFISKPIDLPEVLLRVRNCLELSQAAKQLRDVNAELERKVELRTVQLASSYKAISSSLNRAASYRDDDTGQHIVRIGESSALLAKAIGMPSQWCELMKMAAPLHDIGKIGIADAILQKPGALTPQERQIMQEHARIGYEILRDPHGSPLTDLAAEIALAHHERWDGTGYPNGLQGTQIPLSARIVSICDVYDAIRMPRAYKQAWDVERSRRFITDQAGTQFDPFLVDIFSSLFDEIDRLRSPDGSEA
ncbi:response regulator [Pseudomonas rhodesiae]|uniref:HD-GYP domain-containing protein n=1 Tax=Pseudomonas rhodesiae TaxID=76760 RepID=UPI000B8C3F50|nr:HD domain-containing phosphohydrolase [Pseudomonas rhodesiae]OXS19763.1 two-component system response regulator [Pseudomonas fluorescens]OZO46739.1 two-component system response regulator [Pseudomonas fluorescens]TGY15960.1 response regulator [Pseudomonas fluorescens]WLI27101.1 response regulator [Pseudomonas rhodesiae]